MNHALPLRVQVLNNHILTQNQYSNYYYPKPKYLIIGYMDPLGSYVSPSLAWAHDLGSRDVEGVNGLALRSLHVWQVLMYETGMYMLLLALIRKKQSKSCYDILTLGPQNYLRGD